MARNPIIAQRALKAALEAEKAKNSPPPAPKPETPEVPEVPVVSEVPTVSKVDADSLEILPDAELRDRAKTLYGTLYDPSWDRDALIEKLVLKGVKA